MITDIQPIAPSANVRTGYPTEKPLPLLERIIATSCPLNGVVLDPFCGCATTLVAAGDLGRAWAGIDISPKAAELVVQRIEERQGLWRDIVHRTDAPMRTDIGRLPHYRAHRQALYGQQEGNCAGCGAHFEARHLEVDHIISRRNGGRITPRTSNFCAARATASRETGAWSTCASNFIFDSISL